MYGTPIVPLTSNALFLTIKLMASFLIRLLALSYEVSKRVLAILFSGPFSSLNSSGLSQLSTDFSIGDT